MQSEVFSYVCRLAFVTRHEVSGFEGAFLGTFGKFGGGGEEDVAGAVQSRFARVLQNADDETDADDLHGDIVVDAEA